MNAQGETWTAESALWRAICDAPTVSQSLALREAYAIVRLHPELVAVLEKVSERFMSTHTDYIFSKRAALDDVQVVLARAHALGEER